MAKALSSAEVERWRAEAMALTAAEVGRLTRLPFSVAVGEAVDVVQFYDQHWKAQRQGGTVVMPGFELVAGKPNPLIQKGLGADIFSLVQAVGHAHANYQLAVERLPATPLERGHELLSELRASLVYLFDDGVEDQEDARLAKLADVHADSRFTLDGLAVALTDYGTMANLHRAALEGLGTFSVATIDEALALVDTLRLRSPTPASQTEEARAAKDLRDRLLTLMDVRVRAVRAAARYVFRGHPELVRDVGSSHERRRRAAARRASSQEPATQPSDQDDRITQPAGSAAQ